MTKSKKKKAAAKQDPKVAEANRIRITKILHEFRAGPQEEYTFEANLKNCDRAVVHQLCLKMGLTSKSYGRGHQRSVTVYKYKRNGDSKTGKEKCAAFMFSEDAKEVLQNLFTQYPPECLDQIVVEHNEKSEKIKRRKDDIFCKPSMNKTEISKKVEALASKVEKTPNLRQVFEQRSKLPILPFKDAITSTIEANQVVLISGETGCGKTTQVPQFLLDYMWGKGEACKIVCTQPRRISATSVAERISFERGENVGDTVGYKIRLENRGGKHSSIVFCTNGVLLRVVVSNGNTAGLKKKASNKNANDYVSNLTHIIVDEIHERDRYSDFMLAILRDMLPSYPHLRLVLMSATLDADRFSQYFGGCPIIRVPGFTYPVKTYYLEDILHILKSTENNHLGCTSGSIPTNDTELTEEYRVSLDEAISMALLNDELSLLIDLVSTGAGSRIVNYQHSLTGVTPLMVFAGKGRIGNICILLSFGADCHLRDNDGATALDWAQKENQGEAAEIIKGHLEKSNSSNEEEQSLLDKYLSTINPELTDVVLIEKLLYKICLDSKDGAILVFLPGWDDINKTKERLLNNPYFKNSSKFTVISLHSMVPSMEQKKVFKRPPNGCRKIVLSTNIAETAITIDDVVYVIDSGRMKEKSYDPFNNVSTLQSSWVSKASAKQREGRAGRCQPGICYHLFSKVLAASMQDFQVPEIKRMPIEELCLQVKLIDPNCKIEDFLRKTLDPPIFETIRNAVVVLQEIGALSLDESLTELGQKLGCLPVHPLISKMLFFAIMLNCLDPALTLACASDYRDPFTLPMLPIERKRATAAKFELASIYGGHSDQLAVIAAFDCWRNAKERGQEARFCSQYFVNSGTMNMLFGMRRQLQNELCRHGFIPENVSSCSINAQDPGILHAVLVAGLYPLVGRLLPPHRSGQRVVVETARGDKVRLHPHSINFKLSFMKSDARPLIMYDEITRGDGGMHIKNCSVVGPLPLLLQSSEIVVVPDKDDDGDTVVDDDGDTVVDDDVGEDDIDRNNTEMCEKPKAERGEKIMSSPDNKVKIVIDRWLSFDTTALDVAQVYCLRERLTAAILFKVTNPKQALPESLEATMNAIACILSYDGMSCISLPVEFAGPGNAVKIDQSASVRDKVAGHKPSSFLKSISTGETHQNSPRNGKGRAPASKGKGHQNGSSGHASFTSPSSAVMHPHEWPQSQGHGPARVESIPVNRRYLHGKGRAPASKGKARQNGFSGNASSPSASVFMNPQEISQSQGLGTARDESVPVIRRGDSFKRPRGN